MRRRITLCIALAGAMLLALPVMADRIPFPDDTPCGPFETIERGGFPVSGYDPDPGCTDLICAGEDLVIHDQATWESFWSRFISNIFVWDPDLGEWVPSTEPPPTVNFSEKMVVATYMGRRRTLGYGTTITCVQYIESDILPGNIHSLRVTVREVSPGPNCIVQQAFSSPYHIVEVDRPDTLPLGDPQVTFVHSSLITQCSPDGGDIGLCRVCGPGGSGSTGGGIGSIPCCE